MGTRNEEYRVWERGTRNTEYGNGEEGEERE